MTKSTKSLRKKALVLGVTGQDGSYIAEFLLEKGYEVHGFTRRSATGNTKNIDHLINDPALFGKRFFLERGDLADATSLFRIISSVRPKELYNFADQDHVSWSYDTPDYSYNITGAAVGRILEIIKLTDKTIRFFQPCSSNMFGKAPQTTQTEETPLNPQSPYACAKVLAFVLTKYYRQAFGLFAATAIFYNHESPRRPEEYLTRKVTKAVARIKAGLQDKLVLGSLDARIDWGYSKEYVEAAWNILQQQKPDDYIIATGEAHSVREWVDKAFAIVNLNADDYITFDKNLLRPSNTSVLIGDASKARKAFGFNPKIRFDKLIAVMVKADQENLKAM